MLFHVFLSCHSNVSPRNSVCVPALVKEGALQLSETLLKHSRAAMCKRTSACKHINAYDTSVKEHTHTHSEKLTLTLLRRSLCSCLIYLHSCKATSWREFESLGGTRGEKAKVTSAALGRSVKGQAFRSPGCVNHINTQTQTLPLRNPPLALTSQRPHSDSVSQISSDAQMLLHVLNIHQKLSFGVLYGRRSGLERAGQTSVTFRKSIQTKIRFLSGK